jgi:hypothetical protein
MRPSPLNDEFQFPTQPACFIVFFWLLLFASVAIAIFAWCREPARRNTPSSSHLDWAG